MNEKTNWNEATCVEAQPAKDFEAIVFNLRDLVQDQELRLNGLQKLSDKLIGQFNVSSEVISMPKSNTQLDSLQGQLEESIIILNRTGNEIDKILERLHNKI